MDNDYTHDDSRFPLLSHQLEGMNTPEAARANLLDAATRDLAWALAAPFEPVPEVVEALPD